jgi:hypothetical protein
MTQEEISIELYDADGRLVHANIAAPDARSDSYGAIGAELNTRGYTPGQWTLVARANRDEWSDVFDVTDRETTSWVDMQLVPSDEMRAAERWATNPLIGDTIDIRVLYLPPFHPVAFGVYQVVDYALEEGKMRARLHEKNMFVADDKGELNLQLFLDPSYTVGEYFVVAALTDDYQPDPNYPSVDGAVQMISIQPGP